MKLILGDEEIVKMLLEAGANRSLKDNNGMTAMQYANEKGN